MPHRCYRFPIGFFLKFETYYFIYFPTCNKNIIQDFIEIKILSTMFVIFGQVLGSEIN